MRIARPGIWMLTLASACWLAAAGCKSSTTVVGGNEDMGVYIDIDMWLAEHDGMYPDGWVPIPDPDGGIAVPLDGGGVFVCYIAPCQGKVYQCGNCMDDDKDGLTDSMDPDCLGPCQNNEAAFFGAIPGQNNAPCKSDCYWDQDTGSGNDKCYWSHKCDPFQQNGSDTPEIGCDYNANTKVAGAPVPGGQKDCEYLLSHQLPECSTYCGALTPNGCDCFGCCEDPNRPGNFVFAGSINSAGAPSCTGNPTTLADPTLCKPCTPLLAGSLCYKQCDRCELCFGKTTLPADCYQSLPDGGGSGGDGGSTDGGGTPPPQQCPPNQAACGLPGQPVCPPGEYCLTGCCAVLIF